MWGWLERRRRRREGKVLKKLFEAGNILVDLGVSRWQGQQRLSPEDLKLSPEQVPDELIRMGWKRLIPREERAKLMSIPQRARAYLDMWALPFPISGVRLIPAANVKTVLDELQLLQAQDKQVVTSFLDRYEMIRSEMLAKYPEFLEALTGAYPSLQDVTSRFAFSFRAFIVDEAYAAQSASIAQDTDAWLTELVGLLRGNVRDVAERAVTMLEKGETVGKPTLEALRRVVDVFLRRDLCQDEQVREQVAKVAGVINASPPEEFKAATGGARHLLLEELKALLGTMTSPIDQVVTSYKRRLLRDEA